MTWKRLNNLTRVWGAAYHVRQSCFCEHDWHRCPYVPTGTYQRQPVQLLDLFERMETGPSLMDHSGPGTVECDSRRLSALLQ
jgi:hypothetical protein